MRVNFFISPVIARSSSREGRRGDLGGGALRLPRPLAEGLAMTPVTIQVVGISHLTHNPTNGILSLRWLQ